jgi:small-conductance mechanosensitive channel
MLKDDGESRASAYQALSLLLKIAGWTLALLIVLDNLGVQISGLLTGLGIGGVAIAFAAQAILGDIFSYFSIFLDKPFEVGDFIIVGEYMGVVEKTGIKTTRIRSLSGEELVFSNKDLTASRIRNYKTMSERRVDFRFGIKYDTPLEKLEKVGEMVKSIIDNIEQIRFDRANFHSFGDFALIFEVVYYIELSDYNIYKDIQETINLELVRTFRDEGIEFAFPTQEIILQGNPG